MEPSDLVMNNLQDLSLSDPDPEYLPFRPTGDKEWLLERLNEIPRYLFRVYTPNSRGVTDKFWTKSMDARDGNLDCRVDILARDDRGAADMLDRHLRWWTGPKDNLVSWTSSLLFALVYMFHLHANSKHGFAFDSIYHCVVDTTKFPGGIFLRDMDLMQAYRQSDANLQNFEKLRSKGKSSGYSGRYYFGEYLSQGALRIKDKCRIVSAQAMIDHGLYNLQPEFEEFSRWKWTDKPSWAKPVVHLREGFYLEKTEWQELSEGEIRAAVGIAQIFGLRWRIPMVANLIGLLPRRIQGSHQIHQVIRALKIPLSEECNPRRTKVMAYDALPEVQQYSDIMRSIYKDHRLMIIEDDVVAAEERLRQGWEESGLEPEDWAPTDQRSTVMECSGTAAVLQRLDTLTDLIERMRREFLGVKRDESL